MRLRGDTYPPEFFHAKKSSFSNPDSKKFVIIMVCVKIESIETFRICLFQENAFALNY